MGSSRRGGLAATEAAEAARTEAGLRSLGELRDHLGMLADLGQREETGIMLGWCGWRRSRSRQRGSRRVCIDPEADGQMGRWDGNWDWDRGGARRRQAMRRRSKEVTAVSVRAWDEDSERRWWWMEVTCTVHAKGAPGGVFSVRAEDEAAERREGWMNELCSWRSCKGSSGSSVFSVRAEDEEVQEEGVWRGAPGSDCTPGPASVRDSGTVGQWDTSEVSEAGP
ncbi:hypothetical protein B0T20DRAFT_391180 [Sordaria brevicollis]|uniref:Uncharacterized protein n=1 Tax=Sordaria brevicollis TaxID=83679 RepID=A0AAE0PGQ1_SORBR|nr:hypothetical protein B0T20DRAFT_391180 [Sordaria brevicollis]